MLRYCWRRLKRPSFVLLFIVCGITSACLWYSISRQESSYDFVTSNVRSLISKPSNLLGMERELRIEDIIITVKTTKSNFPTRISLIASTWLQFAKKQVYFITDDLPDEVHRDVIVDHVIKSSCEVGHHLSALSCKLGLEFDTFMTSRNDAKWWCHFDDDNYVNIHRLRHVLNTYASTDDVYIGKRSILEPYPWLILNKKYDFYFGTGGAGFCISKPLVTKMVPYAFNGSLQNISSYINQNDDCTIAYIICAILKKNFTENLKFHSHLELNVTIHKDRLHEHVSFSYSGENIVNILGPTKFNITEDPTRFLSIHCTLYPDTKFCNENKHTKLGSNVYWVVKTIK